MEVEFRNSYRVDDEDLGKAFITLARCIDNLRDAYEYGPPERHDFDDDQAKFYKRELKKYFKDIKSDSKTGKKALELLKDNFNKVELRAGKYLPKSKKKTNGRKSNK